MLTITSSDDLALEAAYDAPDEAWGTIVFCHPHPRAGGTMEAPLLLALRDELIHRGLGVVRFNFRGIGASEGASGDGIGEIADAEGALAFAAEQVDGPQAILGWSFGAAVAIHTALRHPELGSCIAIAPAVTPRPGWTSGCPPPQEFDSEVPTLVVVASNDDQIDPAEQREWAKGAGVRVEEIKGANHFFWGKYERLSALCGDFVEECLG